MLGAVRPLTRPRARAGADASTRCTQTVCRCPRRCQGHAAGGSSAHARSAPAGPWRAGSAPRLHGRPRADLIDSRVFRSSGGDGAGNRSQEETIVRDRTARSTHIAATRTWKKQRPVLVPSYSIAGSRKQPRLDADNFSSYALRVNNSSCALIISNR